MFLFCFRVKQGFQDKEKEENRQEQKLSFFFSHIKTATIIIIVIHQMGALHKTNK